MIVTCPSNEYIAEFIDSPSTNHQVPAPSARLEPTCATPIVVQPSVASKFTDLGVVRAGRKSDGSSLALPNAADRERMERITLNSDNVFDFLILNEACSNVKAMLDR